MSKENTGIVTLDGLAQNDANALTLMSEQSKSYLSRMQLYTKGKAINKGQVLPGHYGIPEDEDTIIDLGKSVDLLVIAWRPKALDISDRDEIITSYDAESDEFKRIQKQSSVKDSGCMFGPSFLVYERSTQRFLEWFANNESARREAGKLSPFLMKSGEQPKPVTLSSRVAEKKTYSWHVPSVAECSVPIELPPVEQLKSELDRFLNPPSEATEVASEEEAETVKRRAR